ncbi:MAG: sodium:proton antiporter [Acidobacteria bacterium]|nr:sodium:proton antiporter [Acidobacteriota bacterium]
MPAIVPQGSHLSWIAGRFVALVLFLVIALLLPAATPASGGGEAAHGGLGETLNPAWVTFFVLMLLSIAILPIKAEKWWHSNLNKFWIALALGAPILVLYLLKSPASLMHTLDEYIAFILLLTALFVISGGILLRGDLRATPLTNVGFLALGTVLASIMGTTGASMLLIRPLLKTNSERTHTVHTILFFIFSVSNIGGLLTPLGDPPLFMGYLRGVPFTWTLTLYPEWLAVNGLVLLIYFIWDNHALSREPEAALHRDRMLVEPLRILGNLNWPLLIGVVLAVAFITRPHLMPPAWPFHDREVVLVILAALSLWMTPQAVRRGNHYTWHPIIEVGVLFFGIFLTMIPALELLQARGASLGIVQPWQFFWATGLLSAFLDNTPTYLTFFSLAQGLGQTGSLPGVMMSDAVLKAISLGAVFFGAATYIGNAPNFMVKSIAEQRGVTMPSFFAYFGIAVLILFPIFALLTWWVFA